MYEYKGKYGLIPLYKEKNLTQKIFMRSPFKKLVFLISLYPEILGKK